MKNGKFSVVRVPIPKINEEEEKSNDEYSDNNLKNFESSLN